MAGAEVTAVRSARRPLLPPAVRYVALRLLFVPVGGLVVATFSFFLVNLTPSDPVGALIGDMASPEDVARVRAELGLDLPLGLRYLNFLVALVQGDLGASYYGGGDVLDSILARIPSTALLIVLGLALAWGLGILAGGIGAYRPGSLADRVSGAWISFTQALPAYVAALLLLFVFFFLLGWLPAPTGQLSLRVPKPPTVTGAALLDVVFAGRWDALGDAIGHLVIPVVALGLANSVVFARLTRATLAKALASPFSEFARSRGLPERTIVREAFRASKTTLLTYVATVVSGLLGGTAIVESIFNWQGIGQWAVQGMTRSDLPVIQGFVLLSGFVTLLAYVVADLLVLRADPRLRRPYGSSS